jgi:hypothetical protein
MFLGGVGAGCSTKPLPLPQFSRKIANRPFVWCDYFAVTQACVDAGTCNPGKATDDSDYVIDIEVSPEYQKSVNTGRTILVNAFLLPVGYFAHVTEFNVDYNIRVRVVDRTGQEILAYSDTEHAVGYAFGWYSERPDSEPFKKVSAIAFHNLTIRLVERLHNMLEDADRHN